LSESLFVASHHVILRFVFTPRRYRWIILLVVLASLGCLGHGPAVRLLKARAFLTLLSTPSLPVGGLSLIEEDVTVTGTHGPIRARLYRPTRRERRHGIVVAHGIHYQGIDERRLVPFARALANAGLTVLTPELVDLADYRLTRSSVDGIEAAVDYLVHRTDLLDRDRVGLMGFSFAGGLSLVAAAEPKTARQLDYVMSVGGHHNLDRVFHFLLTNEVMTPNGVVQAKAHDYGLAVLLYAHLREFAAGPELTLTQNAFRAWLHEDRETARAVAHSLQGNASRLFHLLEAQKLSELAPELKAAVERYRPELAALSPEGRLQQIPVPVYLLHGAHDAVIPPSETDFADLELAGRPHDALVTPLIEHVEISHEAGLREKLGLVAFMAHIF
jgi:dienelactone hydrolase